MVLTAAVLSGLPRDRPLPIWGERLSSGPDSSRWRRVWIDIREGEIASQRALGEVWVDAAPLMAIDVEALGSWDDRNAQDGLADAVFWGRYAAGVAAEVGAPLIEVQFGAAMFGWLDMPLEQALERAQMVHRLRSDTRRFAVDFRPHTHQWQVMRDVRRSRTESGIIDIAGAQAAMFMTTWGDGSFPVEADLDADGTVVRVRIELGCDKIVAQQRAFEDG